jgi:hypothetical protein
MQLQSCPIVAGSISFRPVVSASVPVPPVADAALNWRPGGLGDMLVANLGDFLYWLYVGRLSFGPV